MAVVVTATLISVAIVSAVFVPTFMAVALIAAVITPAFMTIIPVSIPSAAVDRSSVRIASVVCWSGIVGALNHDIAGKADTDADAHLCVRFLWCCQSECNYQSK
jgi:hypothetical protein